MWLTIIIIILFILAHIATESDEGGEDEAEEEEEPPAKRTRRGSKSAPTPPTKKGKRGQGKGTATPTKSPGRKRKPAESKPRKEKQKLKSALSPSLLSRIKLLEKDPTFETRFVFVAIGTLRLFLCRCHQESSTSQQYKLLLLVIFTNVFTILTMIM